MYHFIIISKLKIGKRLSWVVTSVTLTFDLWPWPFAWTLPWSLVITENYMTIWWWEHSQKGVTDRRTDRDGQTDERAIGDCALAKICWSVCETETWFSDSQSNFLHFELLIASLAQILTELLQFKVLTYFLGPYDVNNEAVHDHLKRRIHNSMIHMYFKFEDDIFCFSVIMENVFFFIHKGI